MRRITRWATAVFATALPFTPAPSQPNLTHAPSPPGQLVDIGGFRLHLHCVGRGTPTIVLIPGAGDYSFDWALIQPALSKETRTCSYDRAGYAWSDLGPNPRTMRQEAAELRRLLQKAGSVVLCCWWVTRSVG
jgi:pimeloyl-ACP methyl ester carboxylesterase